MPNERDAVVAAQMMETALNKYCDAVGVLPLAEYVYRLRALLCEIAATRSAPPSPDHTA